MIQVLPTSYPTILLLILDNYVTLNTITERAWSEVVGQRPAVTFLLSSTEGIVQEASQSIGIDLPSQLPQGWAEIKIRRLKTKCCHESEGELAHLSYRTRLLRLR